MGQDLEEGRRRGQLSLRSGTKIEMDTGMQILIEKCTYTMRYNEIEVRRLETQKKGEMETLCTLDNIVQDKVIGASAVQTQSHKRPI